MSKLVIKPTSQFKKDLTTIKKRHIDFTEFQKVIDTLADCKPLEKNI